jgi:hypothetical protein
MQSRSDRIAVVICSVGRPDCVQQLVRHLADQSRLADRVLCVVTKPEDVIAPGDQAAVSELPAEVIVAQKGLPLQRNAGLDAVAGDCDLVVFFDDDFLPSRYALERLTSLFDARPDISGATGELIADGINGPGLDHDKAVQLVAQHDAQMAQTARPLPFAITRSGLPGLYGCNMAFRLAAIGATRFDEALPLYGWQEDIDFSARIAGLLVRTDALRGVHRGAKTGRETAGHRLGYSQIVNPLYLWRKGTMSSRFATRLVVRNVAANHLKALRPEPWIDRIARARGNWMALFDILRRREDPRRILEM